MDDCCQRCARPIEIKVPTFANARATMHGPVLLTLNRTRMPTYLTEYAGVLLVRLKQNENGFDIKSDRTTKSECSKRWYCISIYVHIESGYQAAASDRIWLFYPPFSPPCGRTR